MIMTAMQPEGFGFFYSEGDLFFFCANDQLNEKDLAYYTTTWLLSK